MLGLFIAVLEAEYNEFCGVGHHLQKFTSGF